MNKSVRAIVGCLFCLLVLKILDWCFPLQIPGNTGDFATLVVDKQGEPLRAFADSNGIWRYQVSIEQVSPLYLTALIHYEDRYFWSHLGINPMSLLRATWQNVTSGRIVSGGSTISMQVARLLHPHRRTLFGKFKQILRTLQLEWHLSKTQILTLYLNYAPFGGTIEGVQAASYRYLAKSAAELTHAEAALLAVLPQAPTRYRPDLNPDKAQQARDKVLDRMVAFKVWSEQTVLDAKIEQVERFRSQQPQLAPLLARRLRKLYPQQSVIKTTIDGQMQLAVAQQASSYVDRLPQGASAGVLVVDNSSGHVKAYVGSGQFHNASRYGHVDMVQAIRSPGSTLKPLLFALALDDGLIHSHSLLADVPITWGDYRPDNFTSGFSGPVSAAQALQRSLNVPFVDLLERFGPERLVDKLAGGGLNLVIPSRDGQKANLAVILGAAGTNLEQLVTAYSSLASGGNSLTLEYLATKARSESRYLLSPESSWVTYQVLSQIDRPSGPRTYAGIKSRQPIAWKTGTSFGYRDSWAIGVTKNYTIGVWVGRPDNTPMPGHHGRKTAGPLMFSLFSLIEPQVTVPDKPENVEQQPICWPLGTQMIKSSQGDNLCHQRQQAWIINHTIPQTYHGAQKHQYRANPAPYWVDKATGLRVNANCGKAEKTQHWQAKWPQVLVPWLNAKIAKHTQMPTPHPDCKNQIFDAYRDIKIKGVTDGAILVSKSAQQLPAITVTTLGSQGQDHWYLNGRYHISRQSGAPWVHSFTQVGNYQLVVIDDAGNLAKVEFEVKNL